MSYLDDVEKKLREILDIDEPDAELWGEKIVKFVRAKLLESYKNGAQAARKQLDKGQSLKPKQKSPAADYRKA